MFFQNKNKNFKTLYAKTVLRKKKKCKKQAS